MININKLSGEKNFLMKTQIFFFRFFKIVIYLLKINFE